jgi:hypothetical protein
MRNLEAKLPGEHWREVGLMARAVYQTSSPPLACLAKDEFMNHSRISRSRRCAIISTTNSSSDLRRRSRARPAHEFTAQIGLDH